MRTIRWSARNTSAVRKMLDWVDSEVPVAHFVPRRSADMTETLWKNIADDDWPKEATAAVYDPTTQQYLPVETGQFIIRNDDDKVEVWTKKQVMTFMEEL